MLARLFAAGIVLGALFGALRAAVPARTHTIDDIPNAALTAQFGQPESPNACLLCHTQKNSDWLKKAIQQWHTNAAMKEANLESARQ